MKRIVLALTGVAMLLLNLMTFVYSDDYPYSFYLDSDGVIDTSRRISSVADVVCSQYHHYFFANGRLLANGLVQWFMSLDCRAVFGVCNALVFMGFVYLVQMVSGRRGWAYTLLVFVLLLALLRAFGEVFLWMSGSLNYLWAGFVNLAFLFVLQRKKIPLAAIPLALVAGWWQESFSMSVSVALCAFMAYGWWKKRSWDAVPLLVCAAYLAGTLLLVLAPGTIDRVSREGADSDYLASHWGQNIIYVLRSMRLFWLLMAVVLVQFFRRKLVWGEFVRKNMFLIIAITAGVVFLLFLGKIAAPRAFFAVETLSLVLLLRVLPLSWPKAVSLSLAAVALVIYLPVMVASWKNLQTMRAFQSEVMKSDENVFFDLPRYSASEAHYLGSLLELNHHSENFAGEAAYYGKPAMRVLPRRLYDELYMTSSFISPEHEWRPGEYSTRELPFSVIPLPKGKPLPAQHEDEECVVFPSGNYLLKDKPDRPMKRMGKRKDHQPLSTPK